MIGWNENYNWTYKQFKKVVITSLEIDDDEYVNLDCEHASYSNMEQIVEWAKKHGYHAEISNNLERVKVWK